MKTTVERVLLERAGSKITLTHKEGGRYKVRIIGWEPGSKEVEGASGIYPVKMLKRDVPLAFPEGTRMKANHDSLCEGSDIRRIMALTEGEPWAEKDGMYTNMLVAPDHVPFIEQFGDAIGLSIYAGAEQEEWSEDQEFNDWGQAIDESGEPIKPTVKRLLTAEESPYNSIDFVEAPGADGRIVARVLEAAQDKIEAGLKGFNIREQASFASGLLHPDPQMSEATPPRQIKEKKKMDEDEKLAFAEAVATATATAVAEALKPTPSANSEATPSTSEIVEAFSTAGLTKEGRELALERIGAGMAVAEAIGKSKAFEEAARAGLSAADPAPAPIVESDSTAEFGITVGEGDRGVAAGTGVLSESEQADFDFITNGGN